ncbi:MAG TPA: pyridine nucleotide-disulfide oxidoreductase [Phycisphaerales bacterium]|nr:pyridine nucleotide-disulfide oxidoreductase [Phycisphaerales bacterium]
MKNVDVLVIGAGAAGLAAAASVCDNGIDPQKIVIVDRQDYAGGILMQCIHNGFGLHTFGEELTGPEYAQRYIDIVNAKKIEMLLSSTVVDIINHDDCKEVIVISPRQGLLRVKTKAIILSMGCRERTRGSINIPGSRPAGIFTAGLVQKLVNMEGYMPGKEFVIVGSGDIGLIMARRLTLEGAKVKAVLEIQPYPGGLERNIVQCLDDFDIPLYTSHAVTNVIGTNRVKAVEVSELTGGKTLIPKMKIDCDTLMLSVGLIPENELSLTAGVKLNPATSGPFVSSDYMTNVKGIFACGNVLHVHDLVDFVSDESAACGKAVVEFISNNEIASQDGNITVHSGNMVRYVVPAVVKHSQPAVLRLRPVNPLENPRIKIISDTGTILADKKLQRAIPSEMITLNLNSVDSNTKSITVCFEVKNGN